MVATPDPASKGRRAVLLAIKLHGPAPIRALAHRARLTLEGVRKVLRALESAGWIRREASDPSRRRGRGRVPTRYALTPLGEEAFPRAYADLAVALIDAVASGAGGASLPGILTAVTESRVAALAPRVADLPLAQRLPAVRAIYREDDEHLSVRRVGTTWRIEERNCPFLAVALARPALCSTTVATLSRLLGVNVVREERFQDGAGRCVFRVDPASPRAIDAPGFSLEPDPTPNRRETSPRPRREA